ncbi:MAG: V-type ATP synthase subunit F [Clostridiales bacterium]|nr:V-type ATP synthase subunit F [Clostridiales bacterium]
MYKIGVLGDKDSISGFASLGLNTFPVTSAEEGVPLLRRLVDSGYAVLYITEQLAALMEAELDRYRDRALPAIVPIPGVQGNTGLGMAMVSKSVEQAVGSDILSGT